MLPKEKDLVIGGHEPELKTKRFIVQSVILSDFEMVSIIDKKINKVIIQFSILPDRNYTYELANSICEFLCKTKTL